MDPLETVKSYLPTKLSKVIVAALIPSASIAFFLPKYWPLSKLVETTTETQLFQVLLLTLTILIGESICLVSIIVKYNQEVKNIDRTKETEHIVPANLNDIQKHILNLLFKRPNMEAKIISFSTHISLEETRFHMLELERMKMVKTEIHGDYPAYEVWLLDQEGRRYVIENEGT